MAELGLDTIYATAIYEVAEEAGTTDETLEELKQIRDLLGEGSEFRRFFLAPTVGVNDKKEVLKKAFDGKIRKETLNFLYVLVDKGRTRHFDRIVTRFDEMVREAEGNILGEVFSVTPLEEEQLARLEEKVGELVRAKVKLTNRVDKSLIGGIKVQVDGKLFDASFKKRLEDLRSAMNREEL